MQLGQTIGKYTITAKLGEGGMGAVFLARHSLIGSQAAIKVLLPEFCDKTNIVNRFLNEARAATSIDHPGIVKIFDFDYHTDQSAFIVMEFLQGENLDKRIKSQGALPVPMALAIARQVAGALAAAHAAGIIHRDLKPENIFLTPDPEVPGGERIRILDFGIAKLGGDMGAAARTRTGAIMGTPKYMAPEQCMGAGKVDLRADLYSLGCILFEMLCGRPPFLGPGAGTILANHINTPPPPPTSLTASVPADVEALVLRLLAKQPDERFRDCEELIAAIDACTGGTRTTIGTLDDDTIAATPAMMVGMPSLAPTSSSPSLATPTQTVQQTTTLSAGAGAVTQAQPQRGMVLYAAIAVVALGLGGAALFISQRSTTSNTTAAASVPPITPASTRQGPPDPPSQETPPPSAASAQPLEVPQPATISIAINSNPAGAEVYRELDGARLGTTPYVLETPALEGEFVFILKHEGYEEKKINISGSRSGDYLFELKRQRSRRSKSSRNDKKANSDSTTDSRKKGSDDDVEIDF